MANPASAKLKVGQWHTQIIPTSKSTNSCSISSVLPSPTLFRPLHVVPSGPPTFKSLTLKEQVCIEELGKMRQRQEIEDLQWWSTLSSKNGRRVKVSQVLHTTPDLTKVIVDDGQIILIGWQWMSLQKIKGRPVHLLVGSNSTIDDTTIIETFDPLVAGENVTVVSKFRML